MVLRLISQGRATGALPSVNKWISEKNPTYPVSSNTMAL